MLHLLEMSLFAFLFQEQSPGDSKDFAILRFHAGPPYEVLKQYIVKPCNCICIVKIFFMTPASLAVILSFTSLAHFIRLSIYI